MVMTPGDDPSWIPRHPAGKQEGERDSRTEYFLRYGLVLCPALVFLGFVTT